MPDWGTLQLLSCPSNFWLAAAVLSDAQQDDAPVGLCGAGGVQWAFTCLHSKVS